VRKVARPGEGDALFGQGVNEGIAVRGHFAMCAPEAFAPLSQDFHFGTLGGQHYTSNHLRFRAFFIFSSGQILTASVPSSFPLPVASRLPSGLQARLHTGPT